MKKRLLALICAGLCLLCGCAKIPVPEPAPVTAYASFFPVYALAERALRGVPEMTLYCLAQPQDGCLRSYTLSDWDAALLDGSDLLILGGRGLESFEESIPEGDMAVLTVMNGMELLSRGEEDEDDHWTGESPWLFLSTRGAQDMAGAITAAMTQLDPDQTDIYLANGAAAAEELTALRGEMLALFEGEELPGVILMQEGLEYLAAELGFDDITSVRRETGAFMGDNELAEALEEMEASGSRLVWIERQAPQNLIAALEDAGYTVCRIDILSDHTPEGGFEAYCEAMRANAESIRGALERMEARA